MEHENALRFNLRECTFQNFLGYTPVFACTSQVKMPDHLCKGCSSPEMVEANIIEASDQQRRTYGNCGDKPLLVGQHVLLSNPTCGKLDPRWTDPGQLRDSRAQ